MGNRYPASLPNALLTPRPLYKEVKSQIIQSLAQGEWGPGESLPSEAKLAARFGVGVSTIRAAVGELVAANILLRKQGKGTFVSMHNKYRDIYQFFHIVPDDGVRALPVSELLFVKEAVAGQEAAQILQIPKGARTFMLRNVLRIAGTPVQVSDIVVPQDLFPGLTESMLRDGGDTLYESYQTCFGVSIIKTTDRLTAIKANPEDAALLAVALNDPLLQIQRVGYTYHEKPVELRYSRVQTQQYHFLLNQGGSE